LNSWQRIFDAKNDVYEAEDDQISYEDKIAEEQEKRKQEFIKVLNRIPIPDNEFMKKGREYEDYVCNGYDDVFSPYVKNGAFQVTITKEVDIDGVPITLYGVLDVLKKGRIMDIKRVFKNYKYPKYKTSHQHPMYLYLVPEAIDFTYLICDSRIDSKNEETRSKAHNLERYTRENCENILDVCSTFIRYLKANDLFDIFIQKWQMKQ
jgi:hypothetical protein